MQHLPVWPTSSSRGHWSVLKKWKRTGQADGVARGVVPPAHPASYSPCAQLLTRMTLLAPTNAENTFGVQPPRRPCGREVEHRASPVTPVTGRIVTKYMNVPMSGSEGLPQNQPEDHPAAVTASPQFS